MKPDDIVPSQGAPGQTPVRTNSRNAPYFPDSRIPQAMHSNNSLPLLPPVSLPGAAGGPGAVNAGAAGSMATTPPTQPLVAGGMSGFPHSHAGYHHQAGNTPGMTNMSNAHISVPHGFGLTNVHHHHAQAGYNNTSSQGFLPATPYNGAMGGGAVPAITSQNSHFSQLGLSGVQGGLQGLQMQGGAQQMEGAGFPGGQAQGHQGGAPAAGNNGSHAWFYGGNQSYREVSP